jgi:hypothetical protein
VLREIGLEPIMTAGTEALFERSLALGLKEAFSEKPETMSDVIDFMERALREPSPAPPDETAACKEVE